jgi:putative oxidoreductase
MSLGRVILRSTVGGLFVGHGTQKLFGWFGGPGIGGVTGMFSQIGLHPPKAHAYAAGVAETGGGAALVLGAGTPLAGSVLIATMLTAIRTVHGKNGPWATSGGWEYNAVLIAACVAIAEVGPGSPSVDAAADNDAMSGPRWAALSLALGALGAAGAAAISSALAPAPEPDPAPADEFAPPAPVEPAAPVAPATPAESAAPDVPDEPAA